MTNKNTNISAFRDEFAAICNVAQPGVYAAARCLLNKAIAAGKLDAEYSDFNRRGHGWALNYSIYDITPAAVLVQRRETHVTKYGCSPTKDYYLVRRCGRGVVVTEAAKSKVARLAKAAQYLGEVIDTLEGRAKTPLKAWSSMQEKAIAYKIVEAREDSFYSVYDEDFEWALGKTRVEAATDSHDGGFYVFETREQALDAFGRKVVFRDAWQEGKRLVLVECVIAGCRYKHANSKLCVSSCRPVRVLEELGVAPLVMAA